MLWITIWVWVHVTWFTCEYFCFSCDTGALFSGRKNCSVPDRAACSGLWTGEFHLPELYQELNQISLWATDVIRDQPEKTLCMQTPIAFPVSSSALQFLFRIYMKEPEKQRSVLGMLVEMEVHAFA